VARGQPATGVTGAMAREGAGFRGAMAREGAIAASGPIAPEAFTPKVVQGVSEKTPPRLGVTLGGVKRRVKPPRAETEAGTRRRQVRG
jgi:hypothetical protein